MKRRNSLSIFLLVGFAAAFLDQLVKLLILKEIMPLPYTSNTGAGFSLFQNANSFLIWVAVIVIGLIFYYRGRIAKESALLYYSASLIFGGALGNLIDRIRLGYVVDFIDLKVWPSFNLADAAITIGAAGLIFCLIKKK